MVFITAGMGGGTGTGAAPIIAQTCLEAGILTVAVVTRPFRFEGTHRMRLAEEGLRRLQDSVDTLLVIPNQNLFRMVDQSTTLLDAFRCVGLWLPLASPLLWMTDRVGSAYFFERL